LHNYSLGTAVDLNHTPAGSSALTTLPLQNVFGALSSIIPKLGTIYFELGIKLKGFPSQIPKPYPHLLILKIQYAR